MAHPKVAVIGGSGVYKQAFIENEREIKVETRFGASVLKQGLYRGRTVFFMARHGGGHTVPPHLVNYRANIAALKKLEVDAVIATAAVGSLRRDMGPGSRVIIDQFIDFTKQRPLTFYEGKEGFVVHTDFSEPYCPNTRAAILRAGRALGQHMVDGGCYICTEGPRFETPAEINMFMNWGVDVVGMTNVPEVVLAREAGLCYGTIALPTNFAAGVSAKPLNQDEVLEAMDTDKLELEKLLAASIAEIKTDASCRCRDAGNNYPKE